MTMVKGTNNTALVYADRIEEKARTQIETLCNMPEFANSKIRIMSDVHAGAGCTIGTTMTISDKVVPGMVGVDIGCGMETVALKDKDIDFDKLDEVIRTLIPSGMDVRQNPHKYISEIREELDGLRCMKFVNLDRAYKSLGTLGGGNHFIEIDRDDDGNLYLVVHSGSRHIGLQTAEYYQKAGYDALCSSSNAQCSFVSKDLAWVQDELFVDYIHDMRIIQKFASLNRRAMVQEILTAMNLVEVYHFTTIHNYIDTDSMILRKGAVSAKKDEMLLIPMNMRDGSLICRGKGNDDWNQSAPHGAGRIMSRKNAFEAFSLEEYKKQMKGIWSSCVVQETLDESPMAYKPMDEILANIEPTAEVVRRIKPVYNFKAAD